MSIYTPTTIADVRQALTDVLDSFDDLTGYPQLPDGALHPGAAWVVKRDSTYDTVAGCIASTEWDAVVLWPAGSNAAPVGASDAMEADIAAAFHRAGFSVTTSAPNPQLTGEYGYPATVFRIVTVTQ